jgi:hypothetical protein
MSDTKTINAIHNLLGDSVLSVLKYNGIWEVSLETPEETVVARRDNLRTALNVITTYMKGE